MASTKSRCAIRIQGLKPEFSLEEFKTMMTVAIKPKQPNATQWSKKNRFSLLTPPTDAFLLATPSSTPTQSSNRPIWTLALRDASDTSSKTATISFASEEIKGKALKRLESTGAVGWGENVEIGDEFERLTVLHASETIDIDICAVHGLGGNAFDTWMGTTKMWLRDLLPSHPSCNHSRIMTFGYNSDLINKKSNAEIKDWADDLLRNVGSVRTTPPESARPIIFVCHSMGGLVCREAMIRLNTQATKYDGISLENCGLLFLSTPHYGSAEADWNPLLAYLADAVVGVRSNSIIDQLRSFNSSSVHAQEAFQTMTTVPPFHCLCEGDDTYIKGKHRRIVTQASAGFCGQTADKILGVDHHTICKFDTVDKGYMDVCLQLRKIRIALFDRDVDRLGKTSKPKVLPGRPSIVAPRYPLTEGSKWFEGSSLRTSTHLTGRVETMDRVMESIGTQDCDVPKLVALTGIGGIGKTEILLEAALRFKDVSHVFFIKATDRESLDHAFLEIAVSIGHDILAIQYRQADLATIWRAYSPQDRIRAFKAWLGHPSNQPSLFIVDDLDGFKDEALIKAALPREARLILYSTRNPSLIGSLEREAQQYVVPDMDLGEVNSLLLTCLRRSGISKDDRLFTGLDALADVVGGHPLAAYRAIAYIISVISHTTDDSPASVFATMFRGADWEARRRFLDYKPTIGLSIMETFDVSAVRLRGNQAETQKFLELLACVSSSDDSLDFRKFLDQRRPWLYQLRPCLPDHDVFKRGLAGQGEYLAELENVSIGVRSSSSSPLRIHPLWRECILQRAGRRGRVRWLQQILIIIHVSYVRGEQEGLTILYPFIHNVLRIAERFGIPLDDIVGSPERKDWIDSL